MYSFQFFGTPESKLALLPFKNFNDLFKGQDIDVIITIETNLYSFLNVIIQLHSSEFY